MPRPHDDILDSGFDEPILNDEPAPSSETEYVLFLMLLIIMYICFFAAFTGSWEAIIVAGLLHFAACVWQLASAISLGLNKRYKGNRWRRIHAICMMASLAIILISIFGLMVVGLGHSIVGDAFAVALMLTFFVVPQPLAWFYFAICLRDARRLSAQRRKEEQL